MTQGQNFSKNDDRSNKTDVVFDYCFVLGRVKGNLKICDTITLSDKNRITNQFSWCVVMVVHIFKMIKVFSCVKEIDLFGNDE